MSTRLSVDIGGTFTDVVLDVDGLLHSIKVLTTYDDPARGVIEGMQAVLAKADVETGQIDLVLHGTTLATNALIERRGATTALLTTAGHRDVLEMAFENRFEQYDVNIDRTEPLVPRFLRLGVPERVAADGAVLLPLDEAVAREQIETAIEHGVESIAVGLLHSYHNPAHEMALAALIEREYPHLTLSLSCQVCPEIREYERFSTTVANAYVKPLMATYLASLQTQLKGLGVTAQILLMTSGGGLTTLATAAAYPIRLVESGPAGGAVLAAHHARALGEEQVVSFDMGGTTAKICLIDQGEPLYSRAFEVDRRYRFKKGSGLPVRIPVVEMVEIGAGGGSLAHVDALKRLQVGPESAASEPGPACYGRGGTGAAVTDADVVMGKLVPEYFAGGQMQLHAEAARTALSEHVMRPLDTASPEQAAFAVGEIVGENMASAARAHAAEWGRDMGSRSMIAFGGAAPLHAVSLAQKLKINTVFVPPDAGVGSAVGFLLAPLRFEVVRSHVSLLSNLEVLEVQALLDEMHTEAAAVLDQARVPGERTEEITAYMRYAGQGYEIAVPAGRDLRNLEDAFTAEYQKLYGRVIPGLAVEILSWTLALGVAADQVTLRSIADASDNTHVSTQAYFDGIASGQILIQRRNGLLAEEAVAGPVLVVEAQTTTVVPSAWQCRLLANGALRLDRMHAEAEQGDERG